MSKVYKIHPAIGIARIGNSPNEQFDGPDVPDLTFTPPPSAHYRGAGEPDWRQAARFRIYEYTLAPGTSEATSVRQITGARPTFSGTFTLPISNRSRVTLPGAIGFRSSMIRA